MTPQEIVSELDRHIVGQQDAKRAVAIALRNRWRRKRLTGMLKDVAYQSRTPDFWNSMDMIGGQKSYWLGGSFGDGKGEPSQSNSVSHGCVPARFKEVNIVNTGRTA